MKAEILDGMTFDELWMLAVSTTDPDVLTAIVAVARKLETPDVIYISVARNEHSGVEALAGVVEADRNSDIDVAQHFNTASEDLHKIALRSLGTHPYLAERPNLSRETLALIVTRKDSEVTTRQLLRMVDSTIDPVVLAIIVESPALHPTVYTAIAKNIHTDAATLAKIVSVGDSNDTLIAVHPNTASTDLYTIASRTPVARMLIAERPNVDPILKLQMLQTEQAERAAQFTPEMIEPPAIVRLPILVQATLEKQESAAQTDVNLIPLDESEQKRSIRFAST